MRLPEAWVLDVDDTLYLERDYVLSGFEVVGQWFQSSQGVRGFADCCWDLFERGERGRIFDQACFELGVQANARLIAKLVDVYRGHYPNISLTPDASEFIKRPPGDKPVAILTGGPPVSQRQKVIALGLTKWANCVVYGGARGPHYDKPNRYGWRTVQQLLGVRPEALVYVGDNPRKDFETPLALGWRVVRVRRPGSEHYEIETPSYVEQVPDLANLEAKWGAS